jgi:integrase
MDAVSWSPRAPTLRDIRRRCRQGGSMKGVKFLAKGFLEAVVPPAKGESFLWSSELPGWGLRVSQTGKRSWIVQCRIDGQSRRTTIGDVRLKSPIEARDRARAILAAAEDNRDLLLEEEAAAVAEKERRDFAEQRTIGKLVDLYLVEPSVRSKRSFGEIERYLVRVWADVHQDSAETVTRDRLGEVLEAIAIERGETTANRARTALSTMFTWALTRGWPDPADPTRRLRLRREASPTMYLHTWDEGSRDRALDLAELGLVWNATAEVGEPMETIVRLLILTGCRKNEIAELRWSEVDLDKALISLPASRTKNKRPHLVPLPPVAVRMLQAVPRTSSTLIFPSIGWSHAKQRLDEAIKQARDGQPLPAFTLHDIRRSVVTGLHEHRLGDPHLIEAIVNHVGGQRGGVAGVYDKSERLADRRRALERWARLILRAAGDREAETAKVVNLR